MQPTQTQINKLNKIFNKLAGKEIEVKQVTVNNGERNISYKDFSSDKTINELKSAIEGMGLRLRVWLPDSIGTCDYRQDRVNTYVEKGADGKYRLEKNFKIG